MRALRYVLQHSDLSTTLTILVQAVVGVVQTPDGSASSVRSSSLALATLVDHLYS